MGAKNRVITGDYAGSLVLGTGNSIPTISLGFGAKNQIRISRDTVETYEILTDEQHKSAGSGIARGLVGGMLLGPVGMIAGGASAKNKGIYTVAIQFKDGKRSLVEVDEKIFKAITRSCF